MRCRVEGKSEIKFFEPINRKPMEQKPVIKSNEIFLCFFPLCYHVLKLCSLSTTYKPFARCVGFEGLFTVVYPKLINEKSLVFQKPVSVAVTVPEDCVTPMTSFPKMTAQSLEFHDRAVGVLHEQEPGRRWRS